MPHALLPEFVQRYLQCKQAAPSTAACIVVPGFLLPVMRPFLKGMHILKTYRKGSTLFDAPAVSGRRCAMAGTHWPVHVFTDAVMPTHTHHLLVNSATLCTRQLCISPQLCPLLLLLSLTSL